MLLQSKALKGKASLHSRTRYRRIMGQAWALVNQGQERPAAASRRCYFHCCLLKRYARKSVWSIAVTSANLTFSSYPDTRIRVIAWFNTPRYSTLPGWQYWVRKVVASCNAQICKG
jgi:hypothetical protein